MSLTELERFELGDSTLLLVNLREQAAAEAALAGSAGWPAFDAIAERAAVNQALLYQHFASKEALFAAAVLEPLEAMITELGELIACADEIEKHRRMRERERRSHVEGVVHDAGDEPRTRARQCTTHT